MTLPGRIAWTLFVSSCLLLGRASGQELDVDDDPELEAEDVMVDIGQRWPYGSPPRVSAVDRTTAKLSNACIQAFEEFDAYGKLKSKGECWTLVVEVSVFILSFLLSFVAFSLVSHCQRCTFIFFPS